MQFSCYMINLLGSSHNLTVNICSNYQHIITPNLVPHKTTTCALLSWVLLCAGNYCISTVRLCEEPNELIIQQENCIVSQLCTAKISISIIVETIT